MTLIVICGATATGKSDLAVAVAKEIGAEIVNADSMQLYRGMDIGTAKLSLEEREGIPHHLLDIVDVSTDVTVAFYQELARAKVDELLGASKPVVIVGGTGFYIKSILDDLNFPETDPEVRAKLTEEAERIGAAALHKRLATLDPAAAVAIPKENVRRVVRALEVIEITGKPFTANLPREDSTRYPQAQQFGLALDRALLELGLLDGKTAQAALGYAQIISAKSGLSADPKTETKIATRQYARRQETWFTRDERITWLKPEPTTVLLERVLASIIKS